MDGCGTLVALVVLIGLISGGIKLYVMIKHPETYLAWQRAEQEKKLMEEKRKAIRDARIGNAAKVGLWLTRNWLGQ